MCRIYNVNPPVEGSNPMKHKEDAAHRHRHSRLMAELSVRGSYDSRALQLHSRMKKCEGPKWHNQYTCRSPACPGCRDRYIGNQRRLAQARFADAPPSEIAMITVVVAAVDDVALIATEMAKFRRDLRNAVDKQRRQSAKWDKFELLAWLEVDSFCFEDYLHLGSDKREQIAGLVKPLDSRCGPVWVVTIHGIVRHGADIEIGSVRAVFDNQWRGHRRVKVQPFMPQKSTIKSIGDIVNYSLKHACITEFYDTERGKITRQEWGNGMIADLYLFLHAWSRGFQSTRVTIKPKKARPKRVDQDDACLPVVVEPMCTMSSFSVFPIDYRYW